MLTRLASLKPFTRMPLGHTSHLHPGIDSDSKELNGQELISVAGCYLIDCWVESAGDSVSWAP